MLSFGSCDQIVPGSLVPDEQHMGTLYQKAITYCYHLVNVITFPLLREATTLTQAEYLVIIFF
jgi:hypothetical protein